MQFKISLASNSFLSAGLFSAFNALFKYFKFNKVAWNLIVYINSPSEYYSDIFRFLIFSLDKIFPSNNPFIIKFVIDFNL